ncbi:UDP-3-O-(3-hydroxymyristoyl)glucosamine N-acyltransferase [Synechococcus sp. UW105]|jgi:UDP-3-O-[3-hydroxymyristoyl] glucosamine N-acyltransferase|uniref:UDP-3-O-(3-hydroxymyristoyl)glucosamine N-acyltransferase n=1 Tax=unclassified Synechococcus TaxID=2626047 RepID=UPI000C8A6229|nr:UDP-3-O-(3-hydroxymyristoyl)glucosamine N-acyltransferase [Synechococcus sp. UW105]MAS26675.1 UDP-3-O-(3-hydroxymyristoyl)glucosamine N-acyltransferase [Synechococcus sp. NAT40]RZO13995.1 MAG: UDP-3-O-(3-hydroxymyristoyl)glucosamine N-acyltransferase [Synechococcus sp. MED-G135]
MRFSQLIANLQQGDAGLQAHQLASDPELRGAASLEKACADQISFLEKGSALATDLETSGVGAVLLPDQEDLKQLADQRGIAWAVLRDPRLAFAETLESLHPSPPSIAGIHPSAVIGDRVELGAGVTIGPHVCIADGSRIGAHTVLHPGVVIYPDVVIAEHCVVHANAVLHPGTRLHPRCVVHSTAVVGSEGFGFVPTAVGWRKMPQTGLVVLEEEVEVGCGSTIDRPSVGETRIGAGTKIDNLVQIGHGVQTGKGCALASQVGIAGGAHLGNGVILAGQVGVANRAEIGDRAIASSKSGIHGEVAAGEVVSGYPAISNRLWLRCSAAFSKLPELTKQLRELKKEITVLKGGTQPPQ